MGEATVGLRGGVCVLAGGTGGLGSVLARRLHAEGAALVLGYRTARPRAEALAGELTAAGGAAPVALVAGDIVDPPTRAALIASARALGPLYGLVTLVGDPARPVGAVATQPEMEVSLRDNYLGPVMLARECMEAMAETATAGSIVMLATMQAVDVFEGSLAYAGPKAALIHASRVLAKEGGAHDIRVNVVAPGVTAAGMAEASIRRGKYDRFIAGGAIRRFGRAEDVARAIRFFLEPDGYVTGQVLTVDGGLTLRRDVLAR